MHRGTRRKGTYLQRHMDPSFAGSFDSSKRSTSAIHHALDREEKRSDVDGTPLSPYIDDTIKGQTLVRYTAGRLKPLTIQLYLCTGIGTSTFGAVNTIPPGTRYQVGVYVHVLQQMFPLLQPLKWV